MPMKNPPHPGGFLLRQFTEHPDGKVRKPKRKIGVWSTRQNRKGRRRKNGEVAE
jgi:plasmid maintenance system antidote protein VapI